MVSGASKTLPLFPRFHASDVIKNDFIPAKDKQLCEKGNWHHQRWSHFQVQGMAPPRLEEKSTNLPYGVTDIIEDDFNSSNMTSFVMTSSSLCHHLWWLHPQVSKPCFGSICSSFAFASLQSSLLYQDLKSQLVDQVSTSSPTLKSTYRAVAATKEGLMPLPKIHIPSPAPTSWITSNMEVVFNGIEEGMQVKCNAKGRHYPLLSPGTWYYYTRGAVPALVVKRCPPNGNFGQVALHLGDTVEDLTKILMRSSRPLQHALHRDSVDKIPVNFYPSFTTNHRNSKHEGEGDEAQVEMTLSTIYWTERTLSTIYWTERTLSTIYLTERTLSTIYLTRSKTVPLSSFAWWRVQFLHLPIHLCLQQGEEPLQMSSGCRTRGLLQHPRYCCAEVTSREWQLLK